VVEQRKSARSSAGFTLIELMMVIIVLGILSAIVIGAIGNAKNTANLNGCKADVQTVASALMGYQNDFNSYKVGGSASGANVTLDDLANLNYLTKQAFGDPDKTYSVSAKIAGTRGQVQVVGKSTATFDVESASSSIDATCRTALGM